MPSPAPTNVSLPDDVAISVRNVNKKFCRHLRRSMAYGIHDLVRNLVGIRPETNSLRRDEFWALHEINFEAKQGEILGIIGANGSGKSTLLRLLSGIFPPDQGAIAIRGRVGALIALGAGFHPHMTGRENIYLNGTILGMSRDEIDEKFDAIVDFSEIGDFLNAPVSTYSSGMRVRLGFAIAVHLEPQVLLVDEVLAVGDASFRAKSYERMLGLLEAGRTICFVSHDLMGIEAICHSVIWLDRGRVAMQGPTQEVIAEYRAQQDRHFLARKTQEDQDTYRAETGEIVITSAETRNQRGEITRELEYRDRLIVRLYYHARQPVKEPFFLVYVQSGVSGAVIFDANMLRDGGEPRELSGRGWLEVDFGPINLYPGVYRIRAMIRKFSNVEFFARREVASFAVVSKPEVYKCPGRFATNYVRDGSAFVVPSTFRWGP